MTDCERLLKIQSKLQGKNDYSTMKKQNVLCDLLSYIDKSTGMLSPRVYIRQYERNFKFLRRVLKKLGYSAEYKEEYNSFFEDYCYMILLTRR